MLDLCWPAELDLSADELTHTRQVRVLHWRVREPHQLDGGCFAMCLSGAKDYTCGGLFRLLFLVLCCYRWE